ncbi:MAG: hypothetical protein LBF78_15945 [Treponema sp.]|jgi:hypothetical protein|nr:hypothetical protein [Treponema sp.]
MNIFDDEGIPLREAVLKEAQEERLKKRRVMLRVFSTDAGKEALNILLHDLNFFEWPKGPGDKILNEYAKFFIRERLGVGDTAKIAEAIIAEAETAALRKGE